VSRKKPFGKRPKPSLLIRLQVRKIHIRKPLPCLGTILLMKKKKTSKLDFNLGILLHAQKEPELSALSASRTSVVVT
jgi:hypothetical protein